MKDVGVDCLLWVILTVIFDPTLQSNEHEPKCIGTLVPFTKGHVLGFWSQTDHTLKLPHNHSLALTIAIGVTQIFSFQIKKKLTAKKDVDKESIVIPIICSNLQSNHNFHLMEIYRMLKNYEHYTKCDTLHEKVSTSIKI